MRTLFASFLFVVAVSTVAGQPGNTAARIDERSFIELGGELQYVEITGASDKNPVLLFLHGGPGWTQTPHLRYFNADLTKTMTLVAWENSGTGKSFMKTPNPKNLSLDQIVKDAHQLTQILKSKFKKDKIFLVGFSSGSIVGLKLVERYPEDYAAYFGISQIISLRNSIKVSRDWIIKQATAKGDKEALTTLRQIERGDPNVCGREIDCFLKQHELLSKYGGSIYRKESEAEIAKAEKLNEDYRDYDWFAAFKYSADRLEKDLFESDFSSLREVKVPVYFLMGRHDWNLPASLTVAFAKKLKAPKKELIWFENSGHEPLGEESRKFNHVLIDRVKDKAPK